MSDNDADFDEFMANIALLSPTQKELMRQLAVVSANAPPEPLERLAQSVQGLPPGQVMNAIADYLFQHWQHNPTG